MSFSAPKKPPDSAASEAEPVLRARILASFLRDCIRLSDEALTWVEALERDRAIGPVRVVNVRGFYECIHTIKGTALMLEEARHVVDALHALEGVLACRSLVDSAADPTWLPAARQALEQTRGELMALQSQVPGPSPRAPLQLAGAGTPIGVRVSLLWEGRETVFFYPQSWVLEILEPRRWQGRFAWQFEGVGIPIRGSRPGAWPALILQDPEGARWVQVFAGTWTLGGSVDSAGAPLPHGPAWVEPAERKVG